MWVVNVLSGGLLLILGILIRVFNLSGLVAGYNTASLKEKARYNEKALTRCVGLMLTVSGGVLIAGAILMALDMASMTVFWVSWSLFTAVIIAGVIYTNTSPRIKSQKR